MTPDPRTTRILELVAEYARDRHTPPAFDPSAPHVPCSGRVFGEEEVVELVRSSLDFWLTAGPEAAAFERKLRAVTGHRHALLVNSGSSANLLALTALTSPRLRDRRLRPGDEVITVAAGFPTTVNPILQNGLVPVFVDVTLPDVQHRRRAGSRPRSATAPGPSWSPTRSATRSTSTRSRRSASATACGSSRTAATLWARPGTAARSARSATWRRSRSTPPTRSRWARAARC